MSLIFRLPECINARRVGYWMESEYDRYGQLAPITWFCNCGDRLDLEVIDHDTMDYTPVSKEDKDQFLSLHTNCTATCFSCNKAPVEKYGYWCKPCQDERD